MNIIARQVPPRAAWALEQAGVHPLLARLYAARGVQSHDELDDGLARLLAPTGLKGIEDAARLLADAIAAQQRICIVADYDCDGATACAVAMRGLALLGAQHVEYLVPDRVVDGYGLTAPIARRVKERGADLLVTVDNGIASVDGVAEAKALGLSVLITDHHLPGEQLPVADATVNPNQPGCSFESKSMAGVGVMFYVLLALRTELRTRGHFDKATQPRLEPLLPLVALGTVADVVRLDANNRRLVAQGLRRIRAGHAPAGIAALFAASGRKMEAATSFDFGFALGPRINAAGRLADMSLGIECLLTDDAGRAALLANQLDAINRERREIEGGMREQALLMAENLFEEGAEPPPAISVFDAEFHEGVVGIVASRIKDKLHRPTFVFAASGAPGANGELKGSGRSIAGFHLRDALDLVAKRHPGVLIKFGGHAMAAGCTLAADQFEVFEQALAQVAREWLDAAALTRRIETDGALAPEYCRADLVDTLHREVWGQGFAPPTFSEEVQVLSQRLVGERHLSLKLMHQGRPVDGIWFGHTDPLPARVLLAFRLDVNEWKGERKVQFLVEGAQV
ncbi:MAG: single-stranded-DNA-specific exonuclease RecJ [Giesbergeria sp.]